MIGRRLAKTRQMLDRWEADGASPLERIQQFIQMLIMNRAPIMQYGCPVGTLCNELAKLDHVAKVDANRIFTLFRDWLREQFIALGRVPDADALAMHLLMRSQGVATMANAFRDETFIRHEVDQMTEWLKAQSRRPVRAKISNQP